VKLEGNIFAAIAIFLVPVTIVYWYFSKDPTGTTALILTFGLSFMLAYYFLFTARRIDARPEDDVHAEIADSAGELGFFSPHSWWPLALAASCAMLTLGLIFGFWLAALALPFVGASVFGFLFEYYRGDHAH
jgi:cytochrome c oxidase subunit IV